MTSTLPRASEKSSSGSGRPRSPQRRICPNRTTSGVSAMESVTTATRRFAWSGVMTPAEAAAEKSTNPNSPPWARVRPVRNAVSWSWPKSRASPKSTTVLMVTRTETPISSPAQFAATRRRSTLMPTEMKNSPSSSPRNGSMSASSSCR